MKMKERANPILRFLDRYMGIPLIILMGLFKKCRTLPSQMGRIALLKSAGIGDLVLLSAIIQDLQVAFPHASLTLFTGSSNAEMGKMLGVDVVVLPITSPWKCLSQIRQRSFDVWIDCDPWPRINAFFSFFSRSSYRIGFRTANQWRHYIYDGKVDHSKHMHELDNYRRLAALAGSQPLHLPKITLECAPKKEKKVAFHLFSGGARADLKQWEEKKWKELMSFFLQKEYRLVLTGNKADALRLKEWKELWPTERVEIVAGKLTLQQTAETLLQCTCVISVDTGIMHLAAALGCPLIALHGPTSPHRWGALGKNVIAVTPPFPYDPCIQLGFEKTCKKNNCMHAITTAQVKHAFHQLIKDAQQ